MSSNLVPLNTPMHVKYVKTQTPSLCCGVEVWRGECKLWGYGPEFMARVSRFRFRMPLKIHRVEELRPSKSVEAQCPPVGVM
ncbi:hypothetical protein TNCV_2148871 [Trichonephila clavipes]|nr:hypothetical protein TNCV_2148871 [Trichonephila clavipes]